LCRGSFVRNGKGGCRASVGVGAGVGVGVVEVHDFADLDVFEDPGVELGEGVGVCGGRHPAGVRCQLGWGWLGVVDGGEDGRGGLHCCWKRDLGTVSLARWRALEWMTMETAV